MSSQRNNASSECFLCSTCREGYLPLIIPFNMAEKSSNECKHDRFQQIYQERVVNIYGPPVKWAYLKEWRHDLISNNNHFSSGISPCKESVCNESLKFQKLQLKWNPGVMKPENIILDSLCVTDSWWFI